MSLPRQSHLFVMIVGLLLLMLGVLVGTNLPVNEMNERMARDDAAIKTMEEQRRKGIEEWRNSKVPATPPASFLSRP